MHAHTEKIDSFWPFILLAQSAQLKMVRVREISPLFFFPIFS